MADEAALDGCDITALDLRKRDTREQFTALGALTLRARSSRGRVSTPKGNIVTWLGDHERVTAATLIQRLADGHALAYEAFFTPVGREGDELFNMGAVRIAEALPEAALAALDRAHELVELARRNLFAASRELVEHGVEADFSAIAQEELQALFRLRSRARAAVEILAAFPCLATAPSKGGESPPL